MIRDLQESILLKSRRWPDLARGCSTVYGKEIGTLDAVPLAGGLRMRLKLS